MTDALKQVIERVGNFFYSEEALVVTKITAELTEKAVQNDIADKIRRLYGSTEPPWWKPFKRQSYWTSRTCRSLALGSTVGGDVDKDR
jgi:hypothetical protein